MSRKALHPGASLSEVGFLSQLQRRHTTYEIPVMETHHVNAHIPGSERNREHTYTLREPRKIPRSTSTSYLKMEDPSPTYSIILLN